MLSCLLEMDIENKIPAQGNCKYIYVYIYIHNILKNMVLIWGCPRVNQPDASSHESRSHWVCLGPRTSWSSWLDSHHVGPNRSVHGIWFSWHPPMSCWACIFDKRPLKKAGGLPVKGSALIQPCIGSALVKGLNYPSQCWGSAVSPWAHQLSVDFCPWNFWPRSTAGRLPANWSGASL